MLEKFIKKNQANFEELLASFIKKRSLDNNLDDINATINFLSDILTKLLNANIDIISTAGNPAILATISPGKKHSYLFYGHYDVQPPGNLNAWHSDPFTLTKHDHRYFGRGVGDNKGQLLAQICGIYTYKQVYGELPFTLQLFIEGEEETGSHHLEYAINQIKQRITLPDAIFIIDGSFNQSGQHVLRLGNRGVLSFRLTATTGTTDLHSGNFGNVSQNASNVLLATINKILDPSTGKCRISEYYQAVRPMTSLEESWLIKLPMPTNIPAPLFKNKQDYYHKLMFEPTMTINSLTAGYQGSEIKTIIPATASALIDCRLVAGQTCAVIKNILNRVLADKITSGQVKVEYLVELEPTKIAPDHPLIPIIAQAIKLAVGDVLIEPVMPGSVPTAIWKQTLGADSFIIPLANYDQNNHAPNENLTVNAYFEGIKIIFSLCRQLANHL